MPLLAANETVVQKLLVGVLVGIGTQLSTSDEAFVFHGETRCPVGVDRGCRPNICCSTRAVQQAQALQAVDPGRPFELDVHITQDGYGWGLWQRQEYLGLCSQLWKGAEVRCYLIEKQWAAVYTALVAPEASTGMAKLLVRTT